MIAPTRDTRSAVRRMAAREHAAIVGWVRVKGHWVVELRDHAVWPDYTNRHRTVKLPQSCQ